MKTLTVTEAARNFSELVSRVHYQGEDALLMKGGRPMVKMVAVRRPATGRELAEIWSKLPRLNAVEAEAFEKDVADSRRKLPPVASKWD
jgi:antitoxin (DNA-binding transcriptional repressor) of toxin-antitoxin stability system